MKAPEFNLPEKYWINTVPLSMKLARGKALLLYFWAYSNHNCMILLPELKLMWNHYKSKDFILLGVHTPKFGFERSFDNLIGAVKRYGIGFPVAHDSEGKLWNTFGYTSFPRSALIKDGKVIFEHAGESGFFEVDKRIAAELGEKPAGVSIKDPVFPPALSPPVYAGLNLGTGVASTKVCTKEGCDEYLDTGSHDMNRIYLQGDWLHEEECLAFEGKDGYLLLKAFAREVSAVMAGSGIAELFIDGRPLVTEQAGKDILISGNASTVQVDHPGIFYLVKLPDYKIFELKIVPVKGIKAYVFRFR